MNKKFVYQVYNNKKEDKIVPNTDNFMLFAILHFYNFILVIDTTIGFGGLEVACWPLVPKFAGSNPAEAVGFLRAKKSSARLPSEGK